MFSAVEYVKRYETAPDQQTVEQLQKLVDGSGLAADEQFVVALLNAVSASDFPLAGAMPEIRKALTEAAGIRELGGSWKEKLDAYVAGIGEEPFEIATFLQGCMSSGLALDHKDTVAGQELVLATPLVLVRQPVFEERAHVSGLLGDYRYRTDVIEVGMGLFEVAAGLRAKKDFTGASKPGILQFTSSDRVATYDGVTVGNRFSNALDTSRRPWYKGVSAQIVPDAPTAVAPNDAPTTRSSEAVGQGAEAARHHHQRHLRHPRRRGGRAEQVPQVLHLRMGLHGRLRRHGPRRRQGELPGDGSAV
ncbi:hypothetical protein [Nonomuraea sp. NPDC050202]|jgi:hypothetical protein|uniref:hypothetical protein n=1 Tax=Nonomuraea sp. NPDC050202 TaxID=3155035 RepID=UPI00340F7868